MTGPKALWRRFRGLAAWKQWAAWIAVVVVVIAVVPVEEDVEPVPVATVTQPVTVTQAVTVTQPPTATTAAPAVVASSTEDPAPLSTRPPRITPRDRLDAALRTLDANVQSVTSDKIVIAADTPSGGFEGASTGDLNMEAGQIFAAIYGRAGYGRSSVIVFSGGLINTKTGNDKPDSRTGIYRMSSQEAGAIRWLDEDRLLNIAWQNYREFAHPALKVDENGFDPR